MRESYSDPGAGSTARAGFAPAVVAEPSAPAARDLIAQLLPGADAAKLVFALVAERKARDGVSSSTVPYHSEEQVATRELRQVRSDLALGRSARALQHAFNNPLTALLAEAQLLELEPLADEHRGAVSRILAQARRLVLLSRKLGIAEPDSPIG